MASDLISNWTLEVHSVKEYQITGQLIIEEDREIEDLTAEELREACNFQKVTR